MEKKTSVIWIGATLYAQTAWGANPVLARYLQSVSHLPTMTLISTGSLLALIVVGIPLLRRIEWRTFLNPKLVLFAAIVVGRGVTNMLAARYTLAIYVQLITLLTPFLVALLSTAVLHEKLPRYTIQAMLLGILGALMIIGGGLVEAGEILDTNRNDLLGISLAIFSSLLLAIYMILVRRSVRDRIRGEALLLVQLFSLAIFGGIMSLLQGEDLSQWGELQTFDWLVFLLFVLGVYAGANLSQIGAIRHLGAAVVSSTMAWRLVSTLFFAALLLDERLSSIWQFLGVVLVLATVTWYLLRQRGPTVTSH